MRNVCRRFDRFSFDTRCAFVGCTVRIRGHKRFGFQFSIFTNERKTRRWEPREKRNLTNNIPRVCSNCIVVTIRIRFYAAVKSRRIHSFWRFGGNGDFPRRDAEYRESPTESHDYCYDQFSHRLRESKRLKSKSQTRCTTAQGWTDPKR